MIDFDIIKTEDGIDIRTSGGGGSITLNGQPIITAKDVDDEFLTTSENPVQNKIVTEKFVEINNKINSNSYNGVFYHNQTLSLTNYDDKKVIKLINDVTSFSFETSGKPVVLIGSLHCKVNTGNFWIFANIDGTDYELGVWASTNYIIAPFYLTVRNLPAGNHTISFKVSGGSVSTFNTAPWTYTKVTIFEI